MTKQKIMRLEDDQRGVEVDLYTDGSYKIVKNNIEEED